MVNLHHLQETFSAKTPPRSGPMTLATPYDAPRIPVKAALICGLAENAMIVYEPEAIPAPPRPAIARPTMRAVLFGATPAEVRKISIDSSMGRTYHKADYQSQTRRVPSRR